TLTVSVHGQSRPKPTTVLALKTNTLVTSSPTDDIRTVNGIQVNLEPIHKWSTSNKGERPLKHWKFITFNEYLGLINGGHCFNVTIDDKEKKQILLQSVP